MHIRLFFIFLIIFFTSSQKTVYPSGAFPMDDSDKSIIGINQNYRIKVNDTLIDLARRFDVGYNEIVMANPEVDPWVPEEDKNIIIPTSWIVPDLTGEGVLINLPEMRLYFFFKIDDKRFVKTFPLGIGRKGFNTPTGTFHITAKVEEPVWGVPETIRKKNPELPLFVPPGIDNPLGKYWIELSIEGYGIHGTNRPYGIGRKVSHGCIRLYPEDIEVLFKFVKTGTTVMIVDQPVKIGEKNGKVYIEVHGEGISRRDLISKAVKKTGEKRLLDRIETMLLYKAVESSTGLPTPVSKKTTSFVSSQKP